MVIPIPSARISSRPEFALAAAVDQHAAGQHDDQSHERPEQPPRALPRHGQNQSGNWIDEAGAGHTAQPRKHVLDRKRGGVSPCVALPSTIATHHGEANQHEYGYANERRPPAGTDGHRDLAWPRNRVGGFATGGPMVLPPDLGIKPGANYSQACPQPLSGRGIVRLP